MSTNNVAGPFYIEPTLEKSGNAIPFTSNMGRFYNFEINGPPRNDTKSNITEGMLTLSNFTSNPNGLFLFAVGPWVQMNWMTYLVNIFKWLEKRMTKKNRKNDKPNHASPMTTHVYLLKPKL